MEFLDKLTKKASETYKGAAEKTGKIAKEAKLKMKINENKSKINDLYEEMGKKVYQKHLSAEEICIKDDLQEECEKIDILSAEIDSYHEEILNLSDIKICVKCKEAISKEAKFCPKCGEMQPTQDEQTQNEEKDELLEPEVIGVEPAQISTDVQDIYEKDKEETEET